jgi:hypothetical protein
MIRPTQRGATIKAKAFLTEADLCAAFIAAVEKPWVCYGETAGWDILVVNSVDDRQIGIQAKLKLNAKVMAQAVEGPSWHGVAGPDYRAVLVPADQQNDLTVLAPFCGITIIGIRTPGTYNYGLPFSPDLPVGVSYAPGHDDNWYEQLPGKRHHVPEYVPDVIAGASSPIQLTKWKIAALQLAVLLENTGYLTRADFKRFQIDIRRWIGGESWLRATPTGFVQGPRYPNFRAQHPKVWAEIEAEPKKWERPTPLMEFMAT